MFCRGYLHYLEHECYSVLPLLTRNHEEVVLVDRCITSSGSKSGTTSMSSDQLVLVFNKQVMSNWGSL
jgi:hypothetical protein